MNNIRRNFLKSLISVPVAAVGAVGSVRPASAQSAVDLADGADETVYVFRTNGFLSDRAHHNIQQTWKDAHAGKNAPRLLVLEGGATIDPLGGVPEVHHHHHYHGREDPKLDADPDAYVCKLSPPPRPA